MERRRFSTHLAGNDFPLLQLLVHSKNTFNATKLLIGTKFDENLSKDLKINYTLEGLYLFSSLLSSSFIYVIFSGTQWRYDSEG